MRFYIVPALLAFWIFGAIGATVARAEEPAIPLVAVFCSELDYWTKADMTYAKWSADWQGFVKRLEQRKIGALEHATFSGHGFDECVRTFGSDFEEAEFILRGKQLLEKQKRSVDERPSASLDGESLEISVPMLGNELKIAASEPLAAGIGPSLPGNREQRYASLWQTFLDRLHAKLNPLRSSAQLSEKMN